MGEVLLKKRDFDAAPEEVAPRGGSGRERRQPCGAGLGRWSSDPKASPQPKEEAAGAGEPLAAGAGTTARTYYVAGVLWRTKDPDSATDAFRKALELDPEHSDAALELRLIEQRRGKPGTRAPPACSPDCSSGSGRADGKESACWWRIADVRSLRMTRAFAAQGRLRGGHRPRRRAGPGEGGGGAAGGLRCGAARTRTRSRSARPCAQRDPTCPSSWSAPTGRRRQEPVPWRPAPTTTCRSPCCSRSWCSGCSSCSSAGASRSPARRRH